MVELFGKYYYLDLEGISRVCQTGTEVENEDGTTSQEINIFKYEILKVCVERLMNEYIEPDDAMGLLGTTVSPSFKIAFNTLIKYDILIEDE